MQNYYIKHTNDLTKLFDDRSTAKKHETGRTICNKVELKCYKM